MLQDELVKLGLENVTNYYPYKNPEPYNIDKFESMIIRHIRNGSKIAIFPDSDVDGMFSALEMKSLLELLGCKNIEVIKINKKMHGLTSLIVDRVVEIGADLLITVDSSTNSYDAINRLSIYGIDHCIIDHHEIKEDIHHYPNNTVVINSKDKNNTGFSNVSAGMLCYIIIHDMLNKVKIDKHYKQTFLHKMFVLGYMTLYTDSVDLNDEYNLSVVSNIEICRSFIPVVVSKFMSEYDSLNRHFVEFKFGPRINSVIRREKFDIVYDLLFNRHTDEEFDELIKIIELIYQDSKGAVQYIADVIDVDIHGLYVNANLDDVHLSEYTANIMKNYTGLIANRLVTKYKRLAIVVATDTSDSFKGSVRDPYNRYALDIFDRFCDCGGHMSAFGFRLQKRDMQNFNRQLELSSVELNINKQKSQIIFNEYDFDDRLIYQLRGIAEYNEVSGNTIPKAVIKCKVDNSMRVRNNKKYTTLNWEGVRIVCFNKVYIGDTLWITPALSKDDIVCYGSLELE